MPYLQPDDVAQRVVQAVKNNETMVVMPTILWWFYSFIKALPTNWSDLVVHFFGGTEAMSSFKGRGIEFAMAKKTIHDVAK